MGLIVKVKNEIIYLYNISKENKSSSGEAEADGEQLTWIIFNITVALLNW